MTLEKCSVVIGCRREWIACGGDVPKQFQLIANKPMLMHTVEAFYAYNCQMKIVIVLHPDYFSVGTTYAKNIILPFLS